MGDQGYPQSELIPRKYQEEIFDYARSQNIIAALDTGSGKTHISSLLIKWVASQASMSQGKVILFFVPRVPLVEQQGEYLKRHTMLRVAKLAGEIELADNKGWQRLFNEHDILVMTGQIFINLLTHSYWSLKKVSLIVFDECHHARKNHPYKCLMDEYKLLRPHERPRVFGMTASPIWNPRNAAKSLRDLEENLCSKIVAVIKHTSELDQHAPKPIESVIHYLSSYNGHTDNSYDSPALRSYFYFYDGNEFGWDAVDTKYDVAISQLGPYAADHYLYNELSDRLRAVEPVQEDLGDYALTAGLVQAFESSFGDSVRIPLSWCTAKLRKLVEVLLDNYNADFQGIIFVEQRHIAFHLAFLLSRIQELDGKFQSAALVGQVTTIGSSAIHKTNEKNLRLFKEGVLNLLVATSVAEEGLHFPACDIVIRFDPILTMTSYIQSRGRARKESSKFIIMLEEGDADALIRYEKLRDAEPYLRAAYRVRHPIDDSTQDDMDEDVHQEDLLSRERYIVSGTHAVVSYDNSIALIDYLCSLLPNQDPYLPASKPKYTYQGFGPFSAILRLPPHLPLPREDLKYIGHFKRSRKEAKRAVAFFAARRLHQLGVFNDYLLPGVSHDDENEIGALNREAVSGRLKDLPLTLDVLVKSPWTIDPSLLWLHIIEIDGYIAAGIVTGTRISPVHLFARGHSINIAPSRLIDPAEHGMDEAELKHLLEVSTRTGISWLLTAQQIKRRLGMFLIPVKADGSLDMSTICNMAEHPNGSKDWSGVHDTTNLLVLNRYKRGRPCTIRRIRRDLDPLCVPPPGSREATYSTYLEFFTQNYVRNPSKQMPVSRIGPLIEVLQLERNTNAEYQLTLGASVSSVTYTAPNGYLYPLECCSWISIPLPFRAAFQLLEPICYRLTGIYRARQARLDLGLPLIDDDLLLEALTIPQSNGSFNNQRLETLGDAVLQLSVTVHLYNKYPHKHEGQLTDFRKSAVSNKTLRRLAKVVHLEEFMCGEPVLEKKWKYVDEDLGKNVRRQIPRRSLQDCMEAILAAAFLTGGVAIALVTGHALGVNTGGPAPWSERSYPKPSKPMNQPGPLFRELQNSLGYIFHHPNLPIEAVTHGSFLGEDSPNFSYERLEFLGDALIELVVTEYLYKKFLDYNSAYLTRARARIVCASVLGFVAVRKLSLHKHILFNNVDLSQDLELWTEKFSDVTPREIVRNGWKYDPPKIISDVLESILGAVLIDSDWNYDRAAEVTLYVLQDVLDIIGSEAVVHPMALLLEWCAQNGCTRISVQKLKGDEAKQLGRPAAKAIFHGVEIVSPITAHTRDVAKGLVAERALAFLRDEGQFQDLCDCRRKKEIPN